MHLIDTFQVIPDNVETEHFVAHILFDWLSPGTWIVSEATIQKVGTAMSTIPIPQDESSHQVAQPNPLDKYELRQRLGQSDSAEVWQAFDPQQKRFVVIKILHLDVQSDPDFPVRFMDEAKRVSSLRHPNIVPILDFGFAHSPEVIGTKAYIIMDYVEGQTLADYIHNTSHQGKFPSVPSIVRLLIPISLAIDYAHQRGMIHGDLKPSNILLDKSNTSINPMGQPILSDFGIAHILKTPSRSPGNSSLAASFYTSPEQVQGNPGNERSDLYSLGVILYEMFTGVLPSQGNDLVDAINKRIYATPDSPVLKNPNMLPTLTAVILRNLAKNPAERFPSAAALVVALAKAVDIPVPEHLKRADTLAEQLNMPTYLSPLPASQPPGMTPSSPSWPGMGQPAWGAGIEAPMPAVSTPSTSSAGQSPPPGDRKGSPLQGPGDVSLRTFPMTTGQFPVGQAGPPQVAPLQATVFPAANPPAQGLAQTPPVSPSYPHLTQQQKRSRGLFTGLIVSLIVLLVVVGSGLGAYFVLFRYAALTPAQPIVGHAFFVSSGLLRLNQNSIQGITDEVQINLSNIPDPQPGKSYYAWLLNDHQNGIPDILLGALPLKHGQAMLTYVDPQHNNLLANYSRFLITEENANPPPVNPSLDTSTWSYDAFFSTIPNPKDLQNHFSLYDHLRHLLAEDPKLARVDLHGGLDIWLYKNTTKVLEAAGAARDSQKRCTPDPNNPDCNFVRREIVRILEYLDGIQYVRTDVPPGVGLDPVIPRVALLEFDAVNQVPPGYLKHIGNHLREITISPGVTTDQRALAIRITQDIDNVQGWVNAVHADAKTLVQMNNAQLSQPATFQTLDHMFTQANYAFVGQFDPNTGTVMEGVVQIHYNIQRLATFDVTPCTINNGQNSCA